MIEAPSTQILYLDANQGAASAERTVSTIAFPTPEAIAAVQEKRAVFVLPKLDHVLKIAEMWRVVLVEEGENTKATAMAAFNTVLDQVFPAFTNNANKLDVQRASFALEEPIIRLSQTKRCNGGSLNITRRTTSSGR